jgi:hypothetical protein
MRPREPYACDISRTYFLCSLKLSSLGTWCCLDATGICRHICKQFPTRLHSVCILRGYERVPSHQ